MNDDKLFIIAIGGTGMRCLEAFVHLCAAGLFDNREIDILTLDTDQTNGNKARVENLIDLYNKVKANDTLTPGGTPRADTFFSAKLNLYRFFTDYSTPRRATLAALSQTPNLDDRARQDDQDIADLLFDRDTVQDFKLDHGYRAQTHLGSMLMYHGLVEAAINAKKGGQGVKPHEEELKKFLQLVNRNASRARVFVFGSVFGGTGASSIPVIPEALREALRILTGGTNELNLDKVKFGSTLLTDYFTFNSPTEQQRRREKVIADANNFALNSQAALNFYNGDSTVKRSYKRLYHIGWPTGLKIDYSQGAAGGDVTTGGSEQKNACHIAELMCASAAYDFFNATDLTDKEAQYVFRTVEQTETGALRLTGASFVGDAAGEVFENKLGALLSLAHLFLSRYYGVDSNIIGTNEFLAELEAREKADNPYADISPEQAREIDDYLKEYAYRVVGDRLLPGWLYQINQSLKGGSFLFAPEAFPTDINTLPNVDPGAIFNDEAHNWDASGIFLKSKAVRRFDKFMTIFRNAPEPSEEQAGTLKERFLAHLYGAITEAQSYYPDANN